MELSLVAKHFIGNFITVRDVLDLDHLTAAA